MTNGHHVCVHVSVTVQNYQLRFVKLKEIFSVIFAVYAWKNPRKITDQINECSI